MDLSVIVCVYNTKKELLAECLSSIRHSTLDNNYEILLIDDGSDFDYSDIAREHGADIRKTENRGQLGARLYGISVARGEYTAFVDSDDTVSMNYHRPMLERAKSSHADVVINGWAFRTERTRRVCVRDSTMSRRIFAEGDEALLLYTSQCGREHSFFVLWNKLYRTSLLLGMKKHLENKKSADARLTYSEDALMNYFIFRDAKRVINVNSGFYFYRIHDSQSVTVTDAIKLKRQIDGMSRVLRIMREEIGNNKHASQILKNLESWARLMARTHYANARAMGAKDLYSYIKEKYEVKKSRMPTYRDGEIYASGELLGSNFEDIDSALTEIYLCGRSATANYEIGASCITRIIKDMPYPVHYARLGEFYVPQRSIRLIDKVIYSRYIYKLGMILFKKGSKIRAFLKRHL